MPIEAWVDGSSSGNSEGPGGWGVVLRYGPHYREMSGGEEVTTNQRMEIAAACEALEAISTGHDVQVYSDSGYVIDCMQKGWIPRWQSKGWINSRKDPVANRDLWARLWAATQRHLEAGVEVLWIKTKGHAGVKDNERADELAKEGKEKARREAERRAKREHPEDVCMRLREQHPNFFADFALALGLARIVTYEHTGDRQYLGETDPASRDSDYVDEVFEALKTLVLIDPDMRR